MTRTDSPTGQQRTRHNVNTGALEGTWTFDKKIGVETIHLPDGTQMRRSAAGVTRVFRQSETGVRERKERPQEITFLDQHVRSTQTSTLFRNDASGDVAWERTGVERLDSPGLRVSVTTRAIGKRASSDEVNQVDTITETWRPGTVPARWRASFRHDHPEVLARFGPDVVGYTRTIVTNK